LVSLLSPFRSLEVLIVKVWCFVTAKGSHCSYHLVNSGPPMVAQGRKHLLCGLTMKRTQMMKMTSLMRLRRVSWSMARGSHATILNPGEIFYL
jgi:hypothetical protein